MSAINARLPDSLHKMAKEVATQDHILLNQFITSAIAEKISALTTEGEEHEGSSLNRLQLQLPFHPVQHPPHGRVLLRRHSKQ